MDRWFSYLRVSIYNRFVVVGQEEKEMKGRIHSEGSYTKYTISCVSCGTSHDLMMIPHRNTSGWLVGWVFVCDACRHMVLGSVIQIDVKED